MKAWFTLGPDGELIPKEETTKKQLRRKSSPGLELKVTIDFEQPRSLPQHRRYFGRLKRFYDSMPEDVVRTFYRELLSDLAQNTVIDYMIGHDILKKIAGVESTSFVVMTQEEANEYNRAADEWLDRMEMAIYGEIVSNEDFLRNCDSGGSLSDRQANGKAAPLRINQKRYRVEEWEAVMEGGPVCWHPECQERATESAHRIPQTDGNIKILGYRVVHNRLNQRPSCQKHNFAAMRFDSQEDEEMLIREIHDRLEIWLDPNKLDRYFGRVL